MKVKATVVYTKKVSFEVSDEDGHDLSHKKFENIILDKAAEAVADDIKPFDDIYIEDLKIY